MDTQKLHELMCWLQSQIEHASRSLTESHDLHNFGREAQLEGMRDAFMRCLNKLSETGV